MMSSLYRKKCAEGEKGREKAGSTTPCKECLEPKTTIGREVVNGLRQFLAIHTNQECDTYVMISCSV